MPILAGRVATALFSSVDELLTGAPDVVKVDILAAKNHWVKKSIYVYIQLDSVLNLLLYLKEIRGRYYHNYCKYIEMIKADLKKLRALNNKQKENCAVD